MFAFASLIGLLREDMIIEYVIMILSLFSHSRISTRKKVKEASFYTDLLLVLLELTYLTRERDPLLLDVALHAIASI